MRRPLGTLRIDGGMNEACELETKTATGLSAPCCLAKARSSISRRATVRPIFATVALIDGADAAWRMRARSALRKAQSRWTLATARSGCRKPRQMRDFLCFEKHLRRLRLQSLPLYGRGACDPDKRNSAGLVQQPIYYKCNRSVWSAPERIVIRPRTARCWIRAGVRCFPRQARQEHRAARMPKPLFGYCIFNDFSARDARWGSRGSWGAAKGKDFDTGNVMGPWLVNRGRNAEIL